MFEASNGELRIVIERDKTYGNPRLDPDNLGILLGYTRSFDICDEVPTGVEQYGSWEEWMRAEWLKPQDVLQYPVYGSFDREAGKLRVATKPFTEQYETGQIGFIYVTKDYARERLNVKNLHKVNREQIERILKREIQAVDDYLNGRVFRFDLYQSGERVDGAGGYRWSDWMLAEMQEIWPEAYLELSDALAAEMSGRRKKALSF